MLISSAQNMPHDEHSHEPVLLSVEHASRECTKDGLWLVAVSGGRDSVTLLDALRAVGFRNLVIAHFDHRLRAQNSARDAKFVTELARKTNLRIISDYWKSAEVKSDSIESAARTARYRFFAEAVASTGAQGVLLGHHADDQAETFLWNLLRGAGSAGFAAMAFRTEMRIDGLPLTIFRPLLGVWRDEIDSYVAAHALDFREDATNRSRRFTRNRLRHQIIPWLEQKLGRNVRVPLWRAAEIARAENEWLEDLTGPCSGGSEFRIAELREKPVAFQRRVIHAWLVAQAIPGVGFTEIEAVRSLLDTARSPARVNLPAGLQARRRAGVITIAKQKP